MPASIRKLVTFVEEVRREMDRPIEPPVRRAAAIAVIANPFAGRYVEDLTPLMEIGEELGALLTERAVAALGIEGTAAESYGKAAAVGENGELEHAAAILHPKMGTPVRKVLGKGAALIPSFDRRLPDEPILHVLWILAVPLLRVDPVVLFLPGLDVVAAELALAVAVDDLAVGRDANLTALAA